MDFDPYPWGDLTWFRAASEGLSDAKKARIATVNRVKRGGTSDAIQAGRMIKLAEGTEKEYKQILMEQYRNQVPQHVRDWAAAIPCLGTGALFPRILGLLGHPRVAIPWMWENKTLVSAGPPFERSLRQLWQYAGCGDPLRVPRKNMSREELLACGKRTVIRPLLYTFSSSLVRMHRRSEAVAESRYYKLLTAAKEEAGSRTHAIQCQNHKPPPMRSNGCGTVLHPEWGAPGSPWRPGHIDMHAHRIIAKEFLRDLWVISGE